ncbi:MAG: nucleotidyltransferase family protein [Candidatus Omnitrophica bacterium]|nr:nucleotidyltransferase family protein [Candidatus Omnitrophota bacterium]
MLTKKEIVKAIRDNTAVIKNYGVKRLGVFGSYARSDENKKSDVDILVEFKKGQKLFDNYMELKFFLEKLFHRKVDLVIKDALKPEIRPYVINEVEYA